MGPWKLEKKSHPLPEQSDGHESQTTSPPSLLALTQIPALRRFFWGINPTQGRDGSFTPPPIARAPGLRLSAGAARSLHG